MALVKSPKLTLRKLAALRANAQLSHGPVTLQGRERVRAAHLRHALYSRLGGEALRALGEDPADFKALVESLIETWQPANGFEQRLLLRLARALWRLERSDRIQESMAVRQLEKPEEKAQFLTVWALQQAEAALQLLKPLETAVARADYFTTAKEIELFQELFGLEPQGVPRRILDLLRRLLPPPPQAPAREVDDSTAQEAAGRAVSLPLSESALGASGSAAKPDRQEARQELQGLLAEEIQRREKARAALSSDGGLQPRSPFERDALLAPDHPHTALMVRMEESSFRQVWRLTTLLMRVKRSGGFIPQGEINGEANSPLPPQQGPHRRGFGREKRMLK